MLNKTKSKTTSRTNATTACAIAPARRDSIAPASVLQQRRRPREAAAERFEQQGLAALHLAGAHGFVERERHGTGRRIAMAIDRDDHAIHRQLEALRGRFDDAQIRLVRDQ